MRFAMLLGLVLLAPLALADVTQVTTPPTDPPIGPKVSCTLVQTVPRAAPGQRGCDLFAEATGVHILRARVLGTGHVWAYVDGAPQWMDVNGVPTLVTPQLGDVDCATRLDVPPSGLPDVTPSRTPILSSCSTTLSTSPGGRSDRFHLVAFIDGPGDAVFELTLENVAVATP